MSKYFDRIKDVEIYCHYCKKTWKGHIKEYDNPDNITCPKCDGKIKITYISEVYEIPA
jgi:Zn finger protein HypA/HybF involved in hydrogenase expression